LFSPGGLAEGNLMGQQVTYFLFILVLCFFQSLAMQAIPNHKKKFVATPVIPIALGFGLARLYHINLIIGALVGLAGWVVFAIAYVIVEYILFKDDKVKPL